VKHLTYILIIISSFQTYGQTLVELEKKLSEKMSDSMRLELLVNLSNSSLYTDNSKARKYTNDVIQLAEKINRNWATAKAHKVASSLSIAEGNYSNALKFDNLLLQMVVAMGDSLAVAEALNRVGFAYSELGYFDDAYNYFTRAFIVARNYAQTATDSLHLVIPLHNLGRLFKDLEQYDRAIDHLNLAQGISDRINDTEGLAYTLDELGDIYLKQEKYELARQTFQNALEKTNELDIVFLKPRVYSRLANVNQKMGMYDLALSYYDSAEHLQLLSNNTFGIAEIEHGRGLVKVKRGNLQEAERLFLSSLAKAQDLEARILEMKILVSLSEMKEYQGEYKEALAYYKAHELLEDELYSLEMQNKLSQDQIRFETQGKDFIIEELNRKEAESEAALRQKEFINNILVVIVALFGVLIFSLYRNGQRRRKMNALLMQQQAELENRSNELQELNKVKDKFFSIISHDLRSPINALTGILGLMDKGELSPAEFNLLSKELKLQFNHTKALINNLLDWALLQMDKLSIQPENIYIRKLVTENFQHLDSLQTKNLNLVNNVADDVLAHADKNTLNLVFRNLIMNAMKFTDEGGTIKIDATSKNGEVLIAVADTGIGIKPEVKAILFDKTSPYSSRGTANERGTGLGLILCKEFVEKNGGKIWVESEEGKGSIFKFTLKSATNN